MSTPKARFDIVGTDKTKAAFTSVNKGFSKLTGSVNKFSSAFGLGGVVGTAALVSAGRSALELGSRLTHVSDRLSIGIEQFQTLEAVANDTGSSSEVMERALRNVKNRLQGASEGATSYLDAVSRLNLSVEDLLGLPLERQMEAIAKAYSESTNEAEAFKQVQTLLGEEAGPQLTATLKLIASDGLDPLAEKFRETGRVMSETTAQALESASTEIDIWKRKAIVAVGSVLAKIRNFQSLPVFRNPDQEMEDRVNAALDTDRDIFAAGNVVKTSLAGQTERDFFSNLLAAETESKAEESKPESHNGLPGDISTGVSSFADFVNRAQAVATQKAEAQRDKLIDAVKALPAQINQQPVFG